MKRRINVLTAAVTLTGIAALFVSGAAFAEGKKIGILVWSDEARYRISTKAMLEQLQADGFSDLEVKQESAQANKAVAMRLAQDLAAQKMDLYVGVGTNGVAALQKEISATPIVFNVVYDPVGEGFVAGWEHSKNNLTGASNILPMTEIIRRLKTLVPLKHLAVLYTPGQKNSECQLQDLQAIEKEAAIKVIPVPLSGEDDIASLISLLQGKAEAIFLTGSGFVGKFIDPILDASIKAKIVPVSHLSDYVDKGVLLGAGADMQELGQSTAKEIEEILKGALPTDIPVKRPNRIHFYLNLRTAKAIGLTVPDELKKEAVKIVE